MDNTQRLEGVQEEQGAQERPKFNFPPTSDSRHDGQHTEVGTQYAHGLRHGTAAEAPNPNGGEPPEDLYGTGRNARVGTGKAGGKLRQQPRNNQDGTSQNPQGRHISDKRCCVQVDNVCKPELP